LECRAPLPFLADAEKSSQFRMVVGVETGTVIEMLINSVSIDGDEVPVGGDKG
jgi:hypothetical protein